MVKQINLRYFLFGPVIGVVKCDDDLCKELLKRGRKTTKSHVQYLAGHLDKENIFDNNDKQWFVDNFQNYFIPYFKKLQDVSDPNFYYGIPPYKEVWLSNLWINFMKKGEYNPPHCHDGDFSFVLYLQVPKELGLEYDAIADIERGKGPGLLYFDYGEQLPFSVKSFGKYPEKGDLFLFPGWLMHHVHDFKSDVERISVSGNVNFEVVTKWRMIN